MTLQSGTVEARKMDYVISRTVFISRVLLSTPTIRAIILIVMRLVVTANPDTL